jgi:hypothetical protein
MMINWMAGKTPCRFAFAGLPLLCNLAGTTPLLGADALPDKSRFNLFNPTPEDALRELSPDRPDVTESPYTVDAGHFQLEMDFANFTRDASGGIETQTWNVAPFNFKIGLLNDVDLQLGYDSYLNARTKNTGTGATATRSGFGNFTTRLKINLWGNDRGTTAFALLPFVKFPTGTGALGNNAVEGGLILPLAVTLPAGFDLGSEAGFGYLRDGDGHRYHGDFVNSVTIGHGIAGKLSGYVEFVSEISTEPHAGWISTVDVGLEWRLTKNIQLDCGCNFGATPAADDEHVFGGVTMRF